MALPAGRAPVGWKLLLRNLPEERHHAALRQAAGHEARERGDQRMSQTKEKGPNERPISDNLVETAEAVGVEDFETAREHLHCALAKVNRELNNGDDGEDDE